MVCFWGFVSFPCSGTSFKCCPSSAAEMSIRNIFSFIENFSSFLSCYLSVCSLCCALGNFFRCIFQLLSLSSLVSNILFQLSKKCFISTIIILISRNPIGFFFQICVFVAYSVCTLASLENVAHTITYILCMRLQYCWSLRIQIYLLFGWASPLVACFSFDLVYFSDEVIALS